MIKLTTEEKLQHFYDTSMETAREEAAQELESYKKKLAAQLEEHKEAKLRQAEFELKTESDNLKRQINKSISTKQLHIKRKLSLKQQELKTQLFTEVKSLLEKFTSTPAYTEYLTNKIKTAAAFAGGDEIHFYISPDDAALQADLSSRTGYQVEIAKEPFFGGMKAVIPGKNILIDNTLSSLFEAEKEEYSFSGGLMHE
ncbi:MAG: V-type ATP synthase subunit E [Lachnospiraceae bacterium]